MKFGSGSLTKSRYLSVSAWLLICAAGVLAASSNAVDPPFKPVLEFSTSTTRATAHPDARVTVDTSDSPEDIKSFTINMPDGLWGSLAAVPTPCPYATAQTDSCDASTRIGTVTSVASMKVQPEYPDSTMQLSGHIYMTSPAPENVDDDPAGISAIVHAKVGGVDLGKIVVNGRVVPRYGSLSSVSFPTPPPANAIGTARGVTVVISDVPREITDLHGRTVSFHVDRTVVDMRSDQVAPLSPLLTNPSKCGPTSLTATSDSYQGSTDVASDPVAYTTSDCSTVITGTDVFDFDVANSAPDAKTTSSMEIEMKSGAGAAQAITVRLPEAMAVETTSLGSSSDQCPVSSIEVSNHPTNGMSVFDSSDCPPQAKVGTLRVWTPLLPEALTGDVYFVVSSPIPNLAVEIKPNPAYPDNPAGLYASMVGKSGVTAVSSTCDTACHSISATFKFLPDVPVSRVLMEFNEPDRGALAEEILKVAQASDPNCRSELDTRGTFGYHAYGLTTFGEVDVDPLTISGCSDPGPTFSSSEVSPIARHTVNTSPSFAFSAPSATCSVDVTDDFVESIFVEQPCDSGFSVDVDSPLSAGLHHLMVNPGGGVYISRAFVVDPVTTPDITAPTASLTSGPTGATADSAPTFEFSSDEASYFQCSLDGGAFLPCAGSSPATTGSYTVPDALFASDDNHTFKVRAQDAAGNVGAAVSRTFSVDIPFAPSFDVSLSTTQARAHPDVDITISNLSHEDVDDVTINMPDGFIGGLQGVQTVCPLAVANAGDCTVASQIGTVETEAVIDQSIVRVNGKAYLTEGIVAGDPAGISIKVEAKVQDDIDMGDIIVPVRLQMRPGAHGIDSLVIDVPNSIDPADAGNTIDGVSEFDMRSMKLKIRTGAGAAQPLITNPSSCAPAQFTASMTGKDATTATDTSPLNIAGCDAIGFSPALGIQMLSSATGMAPRYDELITLTASLNANPGDAGIKNATVTLPYGVNIDINKITTESLCEWTNRNNCQAAALLGQAVATSPLLLPGETLSGPVYMMRNPFQFQPNGAATPWILVQLRGRISVDMVGENAYNAKNQLVSTMRTVTNPGAASPYQWFSHLPDAPLTSFSMTVKDMLKVERKPNCPDGSTQITGTLTAHNGSQAAVNSPTEFNCDGVYAKLRSYKNRGKRTTASLRLDVVNKVENKSSMRKVVLNVGPYPHLKINKRGLKRITVKANRKVLKSKCVKTDRRGKRLIITLCRGAATSLDIQFKAGSLIATKKAKKPKFSVSVVKSGGLSQKRSVSIPRNRSTVGPF